MTASQTATSSPKGHSVLLYDGDCGLCQGSVRWLVKHDRAHALFFAPQQYPAARAVFARHRIDRECLNSVMLVTAFDTPAEKLSVLSTAVLDSLKALGGRWRLIAALGRLVPLGLRDHMYRWVARHRRRFFPSPNSCRLPTPAERDRFLYR